MCSSLKYLPESCLSLVCDGLWWLHHPFFTQHAQLNTHPSPLTRHLQAIYSSLSLSPSLILDYDSEAEAKADSGGIEGTTRRKKTILKTKNKIKNKIKILKGKDLESFYQILSILSK